MPFTFEMDDEIGDDYFDADSETESRIARDDFVEQTGNDGGGKRRHRSGHVKNVASPDKRNLTYAAGIVAVAFVLLVMMGAIVFRGVRL